MWGGRGKEWEGVGEEWEGVGEEEWEGAGWEWEREELGTMEGMGRMQDGGEDAEVESKTVLTERYCLQSSVLTTSVLS